MAKKFVKKEMSADKKRVYLEMADGSKVTLLTPKGKRSKYEAQLKNKVIYDVDGKIKRGATHSDLSFMAGYFENDSDRAILYNKQNGIQNKDNKSLQTRIERNKRRKEYLESKNR